MALEAMVFQQDPLSYGCKDNYLYTLIGGGSSSGNWNTHFQASEDNKEKNVNDSVIGVMNNNIIEQSMNANWDSVSSSSPESLSGGASYSVPPSSSAVEATVEATVTAEAGTTGRRKRRRTKSVKNKEEIENQRMTHIAVERNRRKQMNEYLAVLRSLMPPSYVQRGDQASIIGGAINFVKELEQLLHCMKSKKRKNHHQQQQPQKKENNNNNDDFSAFAEFFMFPQYSTRATTHDNCNKKVYPATSSTSEEVMMMMMMQQDNKSSAVADIEVSLVDSHANLKILSKKQPGLFVKMVVGLQSLGFTILHLNVTRAHHMVLTSVTVKVEEESQLNTVDEIAAAVNQLLRTIHEENACTF